MKFEAVGAAPANATVDGLKASYAGAHTSTVMSIAALTDGLKEQLDLQDRSAPSVFTYRLSVPDGATVRLNARGGVSISQSGAADFEISPPFMYDASQAIRAP